MSPGTNAIRSSLIGVPRMTGTPPVAAPSPLQAAALRQKAPSVGPMPVNWYANPVMRQENFQRNMQQALNYAGLRSRAEE